MTAAVTSAGSRLADETMAAAFRALLRDEEPVSPAGLAAELGCDPAELEGAIEVLEQRGRLRRDEQGRVVASAGLSLAPTEHAVSLGGRTLWTWCAKVALGVLATAGADGRIYSRCAETGRPLRLDFEGGGPVSNDLAVFWPSSEFTSSCRSAAEELCPNINFFESSSAAEAWTAGKEVPGEVLPVEEATARAIAWASELGVPERAGRPG
jgi:alkylmercury lyase